MTEPEVVSTHDRFNCALKSQVWEELAAIYSDDYMLVRPDGAALSKQEVLKDLQIGGLEFKDVEVADVKDRIHGDAAILTGVSRTATSRQAREITSRFRLVAVYVADRSGPRPVHIQSASLADRVHLSYVKMHSFLAPYANAASLEVARELDRKVEKALQQAAA